MKFNILLVNDHPAIIKGIKEIIGESFDVESIDTASTTEEAVGLALKNDYEIVLLDSSISGGTGMAALDQMKRARPAFPILVISMYPEEIYGMHSMRMGASGYIDKVNIPEKLVEAMDTVLQGGEYVSEKLHQRLTSSNQSQP
ncbi:response regulator transcription factor [Candidatus Neomarinimicrobiota bacterium]